MQVQLTEHQLEVLRGVSKRDHTSVSELVRRAVDSLIAAGLQPTTSERRRRAIAAAGRFASGKQDVAEHHDDYLADAFDQ